MPRRPRHPAAWLLGGAALALYVATLAHGVGWDDSGELAAGVVRLGIVHQTGYPPYVLLGHLFASVEPFGSDATAANLWSALCAAAAVALAARYVLVTGGGVLGAAVATLLLAVGPVFWFQATTASVYPFFVLALVLLLTAADAWARRPSAGRLAALGAAVGLVLVAHKTGAVFAAGAVAFALAAVPRRRQLHALTAAALPLATVAYIPLRDGFGGFPNGIGEASVWEWVTGTAGETPEAALFGASPHGLWSHAWRLAALVLVSLSPAALVLVPAGLRSLLRERAFLFCCLAPALVTSALVVTTPGAYAYWHLPLLLAGAIAAGAGMRALRGRRAVVAVGALLALAPLAGATFLSKSGREAEGWARATLAALPPGARLSAPWTAYAPMRATQELDGLRRDVRLELDPPAPAEHVVVLSDRPSPPPGAVQIGPSAGASFKGLSGLEYGPLRVGYPPLNARTYRLRTR